MTRILAILVALIPTIASGQVVYYYDAQCWGGGCPQQQQYYQPQPRYQQRPPQRGPAPDGIETEPAEPEFKPLLPPPPPVQTPPMEPKVEPEPIESKLVPIQKRADDAHARIDALEKQLTARIETLAQMQVVVNNDVRQIQEAVTPNYDTIAAEVQKRLTHSATVTLLDGTQKTQTQPLSQPLEFIQHQRTNR